MRAVLAAQLPGVEAVRKRIVPSGSRRWPARSRAGPGETSRGHGLRTPRGNSVSKRCGRVGWTGPRASARPRRARGPPRGSARARADADAEARSKYAKKKTTPILRNVDATGETRVSGTRTNATSRRDTRERDVLSDLPSDDMSKDERFINRTSVYNPTSTPDSDPVLVETAAPGFADQGVAKTDVVVDEDGDAANDFFLADPDPDISREDFQTSAPRDEGEEDSRGGPSQTSPSLKKPGKKKRRTPFARARRARWTSPRSRTCRCPRWRKMTRRVPTRRWAGGWAGARTGARWRCAARARRRA